MSLHICELCLCVLHLKCWWIVPLNSVRYKIKHMLHWVEARAFFTLKERVLNEFLLETFLKPWIRGSWSKQKGVGIFLIIFGSGLACWHSLSLAKYFGFEVHFLSILCDGGELHIKTSAVKWMCKPSLIHVCKFLVNIASNHVQKLKTTAWWRALCRGDGVEGLCRAAMPWDPAFMCSYTTDIWDLLGLGEKLQLPAFGLGWNL